MPEFKKDEQEEIVFSECELCENRKSKPVDCPYCGQFMCATCWESPEHLECCGN